MRESLDAQDGSEGYREGELWLGGLQHARRSTIMGADNCHSDGYRRLEWKLLLLREGDGLYGASLVLAGTRSLCTCHAMVQMIQGIHRLHAGHAGSL